MNARARKPPEKYVPTIKGNKYAVAMTQIAESLKKSKHGLALAQMSVKLMSKGEHRRADIVGIIMAQLSMKAAIAVSRLTMVLVGSLSHLKVAQLAKS